MSWHLKAELIESCSCDMLCPCWFGTEELMIMDQGWCASPLLFRIQKGASDGVTLDGCVLVVAADYPGPTLFDGKGTGRLYIDEKSTPDQRQALETIFHGERGGPMAILAGLIDNWLPTQFTTIEVQEEGDTVTAERWPLWSYPVRSPQKRVGQADDHAKCRFLRWTAVQRRDRPVGPKQVTLVRSRDAAPLRDPIRGARQLPLARGVRRNVVRPDRVVGRIYSDTVTIR